MTSTPHPHPAKFSKPILDVIAGFIFEELQRTGSDSTLFIMDPFAGTGLIHTLQGVSPRIATYGVEIEEEWASQHTNTLCMDMRLLPPDWNNVVHIVATSPTYGNRMADHHDAKDSSKRLTYKHTLGRDLTSGNSGMMHFGDEYKQFHREAWQTVTRILKNKTTSYPGGLFILNVSDFIRRGATVPVCDWHCETILTMGYDLEAERDIPTKRLRYGENRNARVTHEKIFVFRKTGNR